jgi:uncharacterized protein
VSVFLLDVNLLIALLDSAHEHHLRAVKWFEAVKRRKWASCPLTENGFIRIVSQVSYPNSRRTPLHAGESLERFKNAASGAYQFWADDISLSDSSLFDLSVLRGPKELSDVYLAGLALRRGGRLATLDSGIAWRAVRGAGAQLIERVVI